MVRESLAGTGELVIALLCAGPENYSSIGTVHEIACLGKIESHEELEGGKYNIVVAGIHRVRITREIPHSPYRLVEIERIEDAVYNEHSVEILKRHNHLGGLFARFTELATGVKQQVLELMPQLDFESLVNMVAMTLNLEIEQKQALLEINEPAVRCDALIPILQQQLEALLLVRKYEHIKPENPGLN